MNTVRPSIIFAAALAAAASSDAQTTIESRMIARPNVAGQAETTPAAHLPVPAAIAAQPAAVLPANPDEMRQRVAAAVEEVLSLYGNPQFAEVITNDPVKAATLRAQLALVSQADTLRAEVVSLQTKKESLVSEVAAKEKELAYFRNQVTRLRQTLSVAIDRLAQMPAVVGAETPEATK